MTPTRRAALLLAAVGLAALVLPPGLSVALALTLAAATIADGWSVRQSPRLDRRLPLTVSRGVRTPLRVSVGTGGRRLWLRQPPGPFLRIEGGEGAGSLDAAIVGVRRGRHLLPGVASASSGPLGLARVHHRSAPAIEIRVVTDVAGARRLLLRLRRTHAGLASGRALGPLGLGTAFESVRDYTTTDDIRQINWRASARLGRPMSNQYRIEQEREVICVIDCGRLMAAPLVDSTASPAGRTAPPTAHTELPAERSAPPDERTLLDIALDAVTAIALAADEFGDRMGAVVFDDQVRRILPPRHRGGAIATDAIFDLQPRLVDSDFESAFARVSRSRRALLFVFTDLLDEAAARSLAAGVAVFGRHHATVVVSTTDPALAGLTGEDVHPATALVALDVLATRRRAALTLKRQGAQVLEARPERLAERCLDAYLSAKLHGRL